MTFTLDAAWRTNARVAIRPERFGALLYHFDTRRLSFVSSPMLHRVLVGLASAATAREACRTAGVTEADLPAFETALATLAATTMIIPA